MNAIYKFADATTVLRKFGMSIRTLTNVYRCTIESILSRGIKAWFGNCCAQGRKKLHKVYYRWDSTLSMHHSGGTDRFVHKSLRGKGCAELGGKWSGSQDLIGQASYWAVEQ
eukprot:g38450.t1